MTQVTLDCIGLPCPQPVLRTKEALEQGASRVEILLDNEASKNNVSRFARSRGHMVAVSEQPEGCFTLTITAASNTATESFDPKAYQCDPPTKQRLIYVISSDSMGRGNDELGWALLQTYIQTIKDVAPLPGQILFYNSGVKLVTAASGALEALIQLQRQGVEILVCGTCLDFFQLKSAIQVGHISNMYDIMSSMAVADKIVSPY